MILKMMITALLFSSVVISSQAQDLIEQKYSNRVFLHADVHGSSMPVPVYEMAKGWGDSLRTGDYAYADAHFAVGFEYQDWTLSYENRWYYNLNFNNDTAQFYSNVENNIKTNKTYDLDLKVKGLEAEGLRLSKQFQWGNLRIKPSLVGYRINHYQLAKVSGRASDLNGLSVSALIDYHYDQDKILRHDASPDPSYGASMDLGFTYQLERWTFDLKLSDVFNRWQLNASPFTRGCVNLKGDPGANCGSGAVGNGISLQENYHTRIPLTVQAQVAYEPEQVLLSLYQHDRYQRISLYKGWDTALGLLGLSAHTTGQLGVHWRSGWHQLSVLTDHFDWQQAHHLQLQLGFSIPFQ